MFGLTTLGAIHTAIAIVALVTGLVALLRDKEISTGNTLGRTYFWTTVLTCLTGFGIFQRGGFGPPHVLGIVTLLVLAVALAGEKGALGRASRYVAVVAFSLSYFLHWIPGLTETFTRVPIGAPLFTGPEDPALQKAVGVLFVVFLVGAALQVRRLRAGGPRVATA